MTWWDVFQFILFVGACQGIVMGIILWKSKGPKVISNRFLALILFFFAYRLITQGLQSLDIIGYNSWTYHVFIEYNWIYGALIFFYIRSYLYSDQGLTKEDAVHFVPVTIEFVVSNYVKSQNFFWDGTTESLSWLGNKTYIIWMHQPTQYIISTGLILFYVHRSGRLIHEFTADDTKPVQVEEVEWTRLLLRLYKYFSIFVIVLTMGDYFFFDFAFNPRYDVPVYLGLAVLTYWLGLKGFSKKDDVFLTKTSSPVTNLPENFESILDSLEKCMTEQHLYKNPKLTLGELADAVDAKPYQLTQVLNRVIEKSFNLYVNEYRVAEATRLINSKDFEQYTLLTIAYDSGFNSKASFNRVIKKITGRSPKELRDNS